MPALTATPYPLCAINMKTLYSYVYLLLLISVCGCNYSPCDKTINNWISESPSALNEFQLVKKEILSNQAFLDSFTTRGRVFIGGAMSDTNDFAGFDMPRLKEWYKKGRGLISFDKADTLAIYRECDNGGHQAWAHIRKTKFNPKEFNSSVSLIDTLQLPNNWYALVIQCRGCGR